MVNNIATFCYLVHNNFHNAALLALSPNHSIYAISLHVGETGRRKLGKLLTFHPVLAFYLSSLPDLVDDTFIYFEVTSKQLLLIGELIGRGTFADVFKGEWNGQVVAMKKIRLPPGSESVIVPKEVSVLR